MLGWINKFLLIIFDKNKNNSLDGLFGGSFDWDWGGIIESTRYRIVGWSIFSRLVSFVGSSLVD